MLVVPTLHPAHLLRSADEQAGQAKFLNTVIHDFKRAWSLKKRPPNWDERVIWEQDAEGRYVNLFPTVEEVGAFCQYVIESKETLIIDVETTGEEPLNCRLICIGMATPSGRAICVPILTTGGHGYWTPADLYGRIIPYLKFLFAAVEVKKCFHNGAFDTVVLHGQGLPIRGWTDDTLLAHHCIDGELPHGLAYVSSMHLEVPYWKDDVKGDLRWLQLPDITLRSYNLRDCLATARLLRPLLNELKYLHVLDLYREEVANAHIMARATIRGLEIDVMRRDDPTLDKDGKPLGLRPRLHQQKDKALAIMREIADWATFNPDSTTQLRGFLFDHLKFPIVMRTKTKLPSTNKDAMVLLGLAADTRDQKRALRALIDYRQATKMLSTWVEGLPILGDGRIHVAWKMHGTVSGRLSSSPNAQNWNKYIKRMFRAARGCKYVSVDLSQAELRVMAYLSGDEELLRMYVEGINVHTANATLLFQVRCPASAVDHINPQTEAYLREMCPKELSVDYDSLPIADKRQWKGIRTLAKNFVFGDNYGAEASTLYQVIRSKRDPDTNELLFPDVELGQIEALKVVWERLHPKIVRWWRSISDATVEAQGYRCPVSGRLIWYRGGFKRNDMLNRPVQTFVASWMNRQMVLIQEDLDRETGGAAEIVQQVHDMICIETPDAYVEVCKRILVERFNIYFTVPGIGPVTLPADAPTVGDHLDEI